jgi:hypothetical protein
MTKPVTPQEMFDFWQKMVNPGGYPLQSLMFPVLDPKELERKISELEVVEHWLKANLNMLQLSIKSLEYQKAMLKGGERVKAGIERRDEQGEGGEMANPALWAWNMMAQASKDVMEQVSKNAADADRPAGAKKSKTKSRSPKKLPEPEYPHADFEAHFSDSVPARTICRRGGRGSLFVAGGCVRRIRAHMGAATQAESQPALESKPEFKALHAKLVSIYNSRERIPYVTKLGSRFYNFWQDEEEPAGPVETHHARRVPQEGARLGDGARYRRARSEGEGRVDVEGRALPLSRLHALPRVALEGAAPMPWRSASSTPRRRPS